MTTEKVICEKAIFDEGAIKRRKPVKKYTPKSRAEKPEMVRYTLYLTVGTAQKLHALSLKNKRSVAWILREYAAECVKNEEFNKMIGLINQ